MWTGLFFGLFFDRFLDPFLDHWGSTPLVLREGIMFVSKKTRRQIRHHVCLTDVMSQTHPIYACAGNNHARHLISSQCISLQLEARAFKVTLGKKNLMGGKSRAYGTVWSIIFGKLRKFK